MGYLKILPGALLALVFLQNILAIHPHASGDKTEIHHEPHYYGHAISARRIKYAKARGYNNEGIGGDITQKFILMPFASRQNLRALMFFLSLTQGTVGPEFEYKLQQFLKHGLSCPGQEDITFDSFKMKLAHFLKNFIRVAKDNVNAKLHAKYNHERQTQRILENYYAVHYKGNAISKAEMVKSKTKSLVELEKVLRNHGVPEHIRKHVMMLPEPSARYVVSQAFSITNDNIKKDKYHTLNKIVSSTLANSLKIEDFEKQELKILIDNAIQILDNDSKDLLKSLLEVKDLFMESDEFYLLAQKLIRDLQSITGEKIDIFKKLSEKNISLESIANSIKGKLIDASRKHYEELQKDSNKMDVIQEYVSDLKTNVNMSAFVPNLYCLILQDDVGDQVEKLYQEANSVDPIQLGKSVTRYLNGLTRSGHLSRFQMTNFKRSLKLHEVANNFVRFVEVMAKISTEDPKVIDRIQEKKIRAFNKLKIFIINSVTASQTVKEENINLYTKVFKNLNNNLAYAKNEVFQSTRKILPEVVRKNLKAPQIKKKALAVLKSAKNNGYKDLLTNIVDTTKKISSIIHNPKLNYKLKVMSLLEEGFKAMDKKPKEYISKLSVPMINKYYTYISSSIMDNLKDAVIQSMAVKLNAFEREEVRMNMFTYRAVLISIIKPKSVKEADAVKYCKCGISNNAFDNSIVTSSVSENQYPWMALVKASTGDRIVRQAGVVLSDSYVLTSASNILNYLNPKRMRTFLGEHDFEVDFDTPNELIIKVSKVIKHPDFNEKTFHNNLLLLQLQEKIDFTLYYGVQPICLPDPDEQTRRAGLVVGWGDGSQLKRTFVSRTMDSKQCKSFRHNVQNEFCSNHTFSLIYSGSPFMSMNRNIDSVEHKLNGLVSLSEPPRTIYTSIKDSLKWIKEQLGESETCSKSLLD